MSYAEARAARDAINLSAAVGGPSAVLQELEATIAHITRPPLEDCIQIAADIVRKKAVAYLREWIRPSLHGMWINYCLETGEPPLETDKLYLKDSWADGLDDRLERFCEPHRWLLSHDWLGRYTISNQLYSEKALDSWADAFAVEVYKNITFKHPENPQTDEGEEKTPAQILSAVGIVGKDIQAMLATRKEPTQKQVEEHRMSTLQETIAKANQWVVMCGMNDGQIVQLLDNACDSDDGLAQSGAESLGCGKEDIAQFRFMHNTLSLEQIAVIVKSGVAPQAAPQTLPPPPAPPAFDLSQFMGGGQPAQPPVFDQTLPPPYAQPVAGPPPAEPAAPAKRTRGTKEAPGNAVPARCLAILKDHTGIKTEDLGATLGVSRGTFDNYTKGKAHLIPTHEQLAQLGKVLTDKIALLTEAQNLLPKV